MSSIRKVTATAPNGTTVARQSKSKVYTHALAIHSAELADITIPAGTYTVPKQRIRGRNIASYQTTVSQAYVLRGGREGYDIMSFHTSFEAANKAGNSYVNQSAASAAETRTTFGVDARPAAVGFRVVEVEVLDEGFNADLIGKSRDEVLADRAAQYAALYPNG